MPPRVPIAAMVTCVVWAAIAPESAGIAQQPAAARVLLWYRGTPAGTPQLDDLARLRALGFTGIAWPASAAAGRPELRRLAAIVGLEAAEVDASAARTSADVVEIAIARLPAPAALGAAAWRAIGAGARTILIDPFPDSAAAPSDARGALRSWVAPAVALARQVSANQDLFAAARRAPDVPIDERAGDVQVALLETSRSWIVLGTNTGRAPGHAVAHLPAGVRYALWTSLLDGSMMSMLREGDGAKWVVDLAPGEAAVYVIDKVSKKPSPRSKK